jgi:cell filamentation protein
LRDPEALALYEAISVNERSTEPLPAGRFSKSHFKAVHRHLFQDVYGWAGEVRKCRLSKGYSHFCYHEHIEAALSKLFDELRAEGFLKGLDAALFADRLAHYLSELNAIHAFREGNGRAQMSFVTSLAASAGHILDIGRLDARRFMEAMILAFNGREEALAAQVAAIL